MANYQLTQTGAEVQALLDTVASPETTQPVAGSSKLITSGAVSAGLAAQGAQLTELEQKVGTICGLFYLSDNVYNPEFEVAGYALSSGVPSANANYKYSSEYIPCIKGQWISYYGQVTADLDGVSRIAFYDSSKNYLAQKNTNYGAVTNTENDITGSAYIRIQCGKNATDIMVVISDSNPGYTTLPYVAYGKYLLEESLEKTTQDKLADIARISPLFLLSANVYDPTNEVAGYILNNGSPTANGNCKYNPDYIPCRFGQYISYYGQVSGQYDGVTRISFYDSNKVSLGQKNTNFGAVTNTLNDFADSAYIRISCGKDATNVMVEINDTNPGYTTLPYVPFGTFLKRDSLPIGFADQVDTNTADIAELRSGGIPDYLLAELAEVSVKSLPYTSVLNFIWQSDQHVRKNNENYPQLSLVGEIAKSGQLDFAMLGGDVVDGVASGEDKDDLFAYMIESIKKVGLYHTPIWMAKGNHETNFNDYIITGNTDNVVTDPELFRLYFNHLEGDVVFPDGVDFPTYYYKDFDRAKIRVIVLNTSDNIGDDGVTDCNPTESFIRQAQVDWFINALDLSGKEDADEWAVLTMAHAAIISTAYGTKNANSIMMNIMRAFQTGGTYTGNNGGEGLTYQDADGNTISITSGDQFYLSVSVDFTAQGATEYIGHIQGHIHFDGVVCAAHIYSPDVYVINSYPGQKTVDAGSAASGFESYPRTAGTPQMYAFDLVSIDRTNKQWLLTRYGAGGDRTIHYAPITIAVNGTHQLTSKLTGALTWDAYSDGNNKISVSASGLVTGLASSADGYSGLIRAEDTDKNKEYWIFKVTL